MKNVIRKYNKLEKQSLLNKKKCLAELNKNLNDIKIRLNCDCHTPNLYYDKIELQVRCKRCDSDLFDTNFFKDRQFSSSDCIMAVEEKFKNIINTNRILYISLRDIKNNYIDGYYISFNNIVNLGWVMYTDLYFNKNSEYIKLKQDDKDAINGITLDDLKYLSCKLSLKLGKFIKYIDIVQLFDK